MKKVFLFAIAGSTFLFSCHKDKDNNNTTTVTESQVMTDFVGKIALPQYQTLQDKATVLNNAVVALNSNTTDANLATAQAAWRDVRASWESCEGFLVGPVEDDNYDPNMDTWPVDYAQLDSITASTFTFTEPSVAALSQSLRGFHPLEYILWGKDGHTTAAIINANAKDKAYMTALSADILTTCTQLNSSWLSTGGNFQANFLTAGTGSTRYTTKKDAFLAIVAGMSDICDEVGTGKMKEPFDSKDSTKTESPFSHNSMIDFTNNITGAQNVYLCAVNGATGKSLSQLVSQKNLSLDNKIKTEYAVAIVALNNVSVNFETAIWSQRTQLQAAMDAITTLQTTLDGELKTFVNTYVTD